MKTKILAAILIATFCSVSVYSQYFSKDIRKTRNNLVIGTYNIKWIGSDPHDYKKLAKVISNFDICAIQEVKSERGLKKLVRALEDKTGSDWGYFQGMRSRRKSSTGSNAYYESHAVVWKKDRVQADDGLQGNIWDQDDKWRNDPAMFSFRKGNFDFILLSIHTRWSDDEDGTREGEVKSLEVLLKHLNKKYQERDIIIVGDFNYSGSSSQIRNLIQKISYEQIDSNPKTTFKADYSDYASAYDHFLISKKFTLDSYVKNSCLAFDATKYIYGNKSRSSMRKSKSELSDHLPVFAVFKTNLDDDD